MRLTRYSQVALALALIGAGASLFAGWGWVNPVPQGNSLRSVYFTDTAFGTAVGAAGAMVRTTNSGRTWTAAALAGDELDGVARPEPGVWYAAGSASTVLKTTDSGATWVARTFSPPVQLRAISFPVDASTGWVVGDRGVISRTTDGGESWEVQNSGSSTGLTGIQFLDNQTGYAVGLSSRLLRTTDGGVTWHGQTISGTPMVLNGVCFPVDAVTGYVCGDLGRIFKTTDGGTTWSAESLNPALNVELRSICFPVDAVTGYACGDLGTIARTTNGGTTWEAQTGGTGTRNLNSVFFPNSNLTGFCVGDAGIIVKTSDGGNTWTELSRGFAGPIFDLVFPESSDVGYAGSLGAVLKTTDAGLTWNAESLGGMLPLPVNALSFPTNNSTGYAACAMNRIFKTTDGGASWRAESSVGLTGRNYTGISFPLDTVTGYACTKGRVIKTASGGRLWIQMQFPDTTAFLNAISFTSNTVGFAAGVSNVIYNTTNGFQWQSATAPGSGFRSFSFPGGGDIGYVCGDSGVILKTADGGRQWTLLTTGVRVTLRRVLFPVDASTGYAVGDRGTIIMTTDGGATWVTSQAPVARRFSTITFPAGGDVGYVGGDSGTVLKTIDAGVGIAGPADRPGAPGIELKTAPNPVQGGALLSYELPAPARCELRLYDAAGRLVRELLSGRSRQAAGLHTMRLDARGLSGGVYFATLSAGPLSARSRLIVLPTR